MLNRAYSTALLFVAAVFVIVAITPRILPETGLTMERGKKATAAACIRQMPHYRPNPANAC